METPYGLLQVAFKPLYNGEAVFSPLPDPSGLPGAFDLPGSAGSRVEDMRRQLLATHNPLAANSSFATGLLSTINPFSQDANAFTLPSRLPFTPATGFAPLRPAPSVQRPF
jgi:hypothetical protein